MGLMGGDRILGLLIGLDVGLLISVKSVFIGHRTKKEASY